MRAARTLLRVAGAVQGVGFRPWAARTARALGLAGSVRNAAAGVEIEIEGEPAAIERFCAALRDDPPRAARIDALRAATAPPRGAHGFAIAASDAAPADAAPLASIPMDRALCEECRADLFDPRSRRHRFAFGHCAECGPRASVLRALPWDRARTTLAAFDPCAACRREYEDPHDRRFHAESIACPACGPELRARTPDGAALDGDPIERAAAALRAGAIVAVLGGGGYHLAVDASQPRAIARLRERKRRPAKPFAVLVPDLAAAHALGALTALDEALLAGPEHALVIVPKCCGAALDESIAPGLCDVGLLLPFAPVQWLLLFAPGSGPRDAPRFDALVWTSANASGEPTLADPEDVGALAEVADLLLDHDRRVARPNDDPVFRSAPSGPIPIRLSRGTAPLAFTLPGGLVVGEPILAVGSDLKSAPAIACGRRVVLAESTGDLGSVAAADAWRARAADLARHLGLSPKRAAHDLHPDSIGRALAVESAPATFAIAHHHAHAVACLVEHGRTGPVLALALDGFGWGADANAWGGELLRVDLARFERVAHLEPVALPGGDAAAREPWRMAAAWLNRADARPPRAWLARRDPARLAAVRALAARGHPLTTSCGRLFDAAGSLLGCGDVASHEGEVAARLEALASRAPESPPSESPRATAERAIECASLVRAVAEGVEGGTDRAALARAFHDALADRLAAAALGHARALGLGAVVLTGGCFQNRLLSERVAARIAAGGVEALRHRVLPPGDGAIAVGQATIAAARLDDG